LSQGGLSGESGLPGSIPPAGLLGKVCESSGTNYVLAMIFHGHQVMMRRRLT
jgi:hypothetical protein